MQYYSTNNKKQLVSLKKAVLKGLADDRGLYMPTTIPKMTNNFIQNIRNYSFSEISFEVAKAFFSDDLPYKELENIVKEAINFNTPIVQLTEQVNILELWHGPTLAFKDVGARFMARLLGYFSKRSEQKINVLVATSGDTGSAVANGFLNVEGIDVTILYPSGGVSKSQEQQLTTLGNNIKTLEIEGTFDDCQRLVKSAFVDTDLNEKLTLTSANSINIARLIPQSFYYFYAFSRLKDKAKSLVFSVPSGNFGNLTAGLIAKHMGLPVHQFIASTNVNDVVPKYLESGEYSPRPSIATISNAMDVGDPSNFRRMLDIYDDSVEEMRKDLVGYSFTDDQTIKAMQEVYSNYDYIIDPHGAVGYLGMKNYFSDEAHKTKFKEKDRKKISDCNVVIIETAHPAKFAETVKKAIDVDIVIPERLAEYLDKQKQTTKLSNKFEDFKEFLLNTY